MIMDQMFYYTTHLANQKGRDDARKNHCILQ